MAKVGVLLLNLGGPERIQDVGPFLYNLFADPAWRDGVVGLYSFSKSYCIPGHRLGAITASAMRAITAAE